MARPTSRYGRFKATKKKHDLRLARLRHVGFSWFLVAGKWKRGGRKKPHVVTPQSPPDVQRFHGQAGPDVDAGTNFTCTVKYDSATGWGMPHVVVHFVGGPPVRLFPIVHPSHAVARFHVKPHVIVKRRSGQMTAMQRRVWGANWFYHLNGYHSATDPLGRLPNELTFEWGVDTLYAEGDWPVVGPRDVE